MILRVFFILLMLQSATVVFSQENNKEKFGSVSLITSFNVYVKFDNTEAIEVGDTLTISSGGSLKPCLLVQHKSSISCVCIPINGCEIGKDDQIIFRKNASKNEVNGSEKKLNLSVDSISPTKKIKKKERIVGSISAASYSNISTIKEDVHRMMYSLSIDASRINESKFSFESYLNYSQNFIPIENYSYSKTFFRIHSLSLKYDLDSTMSLTVGRKINSKASSLGAMDGIQVEKQFGHFYIGALSGFRPDIFSYDFNSKLFQYGGYMGLQSNNKKRYSLSTFGFLEQRNGAAIDRRYAYFQHSSTWNGKITLFSSAELDLYNKVNENIQNEAHLTNLYASASYRVNKWVDFFISYDTRKRTLYYETFKSNIEMFLSDDEARQGARIRINFSPFKHLSSGLGYSRRFQNSGLNMSENYDGYITFSKIPWIEGSISFNYNSNTSNYLTSQVLAWRYSRSMIKKKLNADIYYRIISYSYLMNELTFEQNYIGCGLSYYTKKRILFGLYGEMAIREEEENYRINARIVKRFQNK